MNTETIQYPTRTTSSILAALVDRIRGRFIRHPRQPVETPPREAIRQADLLRSLPLEEKLRLGMYRYMD